MGSEFTFKISGKIAAKLSVEKQRKKRGKKVKIFIKAVGELEFPFTKLEKTVRKASLRGEISFNMLNLICLLVTQVVMLNRQLNIWVWIQGKGLGQRY